MNKLLVSNHDSKSMINKLLDNKDKKVFSITINYTSDSDLSDELTDLSNEKIPKLVNDAETETEFQISKFPNSRSCEKCCICNENSEVKNKYYDCLKLHLVCDMCFKLKNESHNKHNEKDSGCPVCRAKLNIKFKEPKDLSNEELIYFEKKNINKNNIYIHQNFKFNNNAMKTIIKFNDKQVELYYLNGKPYSYLDMNVGVDGFLYKYDNKYKMFYISVFQNKFQFWDMSRVNLDL